MQMAKEQENSNFNEHASVCPQGEVFELPQENDYEKEYFIINIFLYCFTSYRPI